MQIPTIPMIIRSAWESAKWYLWLGNVHQSLRRIRSDFILDRSVVGSRIARWRRLLEELERARAMAVVIKARKYVMWSCQDGGAERWRVCE
jgi:hypothetical protein